MNNFRSHPNSSASYRTRTSNVSTVRSVSSNNVLTRDKSTIIRRNRDNPISTTTTIPTSDQQYKQNSPRHSDSATNHKEISSSVIDDRSYQRHGFVDGNFSFGKCFDVRSKEKLHCMSYNTHADILVVGTASSLDFYDTIHYTLIVSVPQRGMVSAIVWIPSPPTIGCRNNEYRNDDDGDDDNCNKNLQLLAISDLNGNIILYCVNTEILESQGPTLLYSGTNMNTTQIRCMDAVIYNHYSTKNDTIEQMQLLIVVGDKSGTITIIVFDCSQMIYHPIYKHSRQLYLRYKKESCMEYEVNKFGILGISIEVDHELLAVSTSGGLVQVFSLSHLLSSSSSEYKNALSYGLVWTKQNNSGGAIRDVVFANNTLTYSGYDKCITVVDIAQWAITREMTVQGTVNTIQYDKKNRYIGVGCRDKTFTIFDTSTFVAIKVFHTPSWVTSISWAFDNIVAIRTEPNCVSVMDISPVHQSDIRCALPSQTSIESCGSLSWSRNSQYLVYTIGSKIFVADTHDLDTTGRQFRDVVSYETRSGSTVVRTAFCHAPDKENAIAFIDDDGWLTILHLHSNPCFLELISERLVEPNLKALAWSSDGKELAVGGRKKLLHVYSASGLEQKMDPIAFDGRIWDIQYVPTTIGSTTMYLGIALGDYTTIILDYAMEPLLVISRTLTCRCLTFHPCSPILVVGDGAGSLAVVDCDNGEILIELDLHDRISVVDFSPAGDFLVVGTDACRFTMYETTNYRLQQEFVTDSRPLSASFSTNGFYLALGSTDQCYTIIRLGPLLGIDFIPLHADGGVSGLPQSVLQQVLFRSGDGPSLLQRHMVRGGPDNLRRVAAILHDHPNTVYTLDRRTGEGCFDTALRLRKPGLLKLFLVSLVDGTLNSTDDKHKTFLATTIPQHGREALAEIVKTYPSDFTIDVIRSITFMKVPCGCPRPVESSDPTECGSTSYHDPWPNLECYGRNELERSAKSTRYFSGGGSIRTPAVLPLPGLGNMSFLANLLVSAPAEVFDNEAMALVLRVLWKNYIRRYYYFDVSLFIVYYLCWIGLVEIATISAPSGPILFKSISSLTLLVPVVLFFNTLFACKEIVEGLYGTRYMYWRSMWNTCDVIGIVSVYTYTTILLCTGNHLIPLAVGTTLCLTIKVLSYLRGFSSTGWLLSVLSANFQDVQGFLVIVTTILVGFSVAFRLLFAETGDETFSSLRRSLLSTFELTVMGSYDPMILFETQYTVVAVITFIMAITCVVVVVLNALISILSDSYAKVQEHAVANRRREVASLIVEYMSLLPRWRRMQIEKETTWFHTLLEVDADGSLQVHSDDWEGGLNALRHDMEEMGKLHQQSYERSVERLKTDLDSDLTKFKKDVVAMLEDLTEDVKYLRKAQSQGILNFDGHNIKKAVRAVKSVGQKGSAALFHKDAS